MIPFNFFKKANNSSANFTTEILRLRMFFGLSIPDGGVVSEEQWMSFQQKEIAGAFDNFNVVESVGYYKGDPERSKILTAIIKAEDLKRAKKLASRYSKQFKQDSVMLVTVPVLEWNFIGSDYKED